MVYSPALYDTLPFDPDRDLVEVTLIGRAAFFLIVRRESPLRSFVDVQNAGQRNPIIFGSPGISSPHHLAMQLLKLRSGIDVLNVPHRGMPVVMPELLARRIDVAIADITSALPMLRSGDVRAILVLNDRRNTMFPEVPTAQEAGYDVVAGGWQGVCVSKGTPWDIVSQLDSPLQNALTKEEVAVTLRDNGVEIAAAGPSGFQAFSESENALWRPLIASSVCMWIGGPMFKIAEPIRPPMDPASGIQRLKLHPHQMKDALTATHDVFVLAHLGIPLIDPALLGRQNGTSHWRCP